MKFSFTLKPRIITGQTKHGLVSKIMANHVWTFSRNGSFLGPVVKSGQRSTLRVYNLEKHRKVVKRTIVNGKKKSEIVSPNHWVGFVYDIPLELIQLMEIKVIQDSRTFRIQKLK